MSQIKILLVFGTRPEAIKMAPLLKHLQQDSNFEVRTCVTGQHREMLDQVLNVFDIVPEYDLNLMKSGQDLTDITCAVLQGLRHVLADYQPDRILVHGDTATTFAATLAAFYHKIPVGHVEAGLRTGNLASPWPEEANRQLTAVLSNLHFVPTQVAYNNLQQENIAQTQIHITGNTVIDALLYVVEKLKQPQLITQFEQQFNYLVAARQVGKKVLLVTSHRRENWGQGIENICMALRTLVQNLNMIIVYPVHLGHNIKQPVYRLLADISNIHLIDPVDYLPFVYLMTQADLLLTDSGGIQEEAPSLGKPVLVLRDTTERPEAVDAGTVKLVGTDTQRIVNEVEYLLTHPDAYWQMSKRINPYGDGLASQRIVNILRHYHIPTQM